MMFYQIKVNEHRNNNASDVRQLVKEFDRFLPKLTADLTALLASNQQLKQDDPGWASIMSYRGPALPSDPPNYLQKSWNSTWISIFSWRKYQWRSSFSKTEHYNSAYGYDVILLARRSKLANA